MTDAERLLILNTAEEVGSIRTQALLRDFGSLERVFRAKEREFAEVKEIGPRIAPKIINAIKETDLAKEISLIEKHGVEIVTFLDNNYPENLKNIHSPPIVIYVKGKILERDNLAIAIVGSRLASFYGLQTAERFGFELASQGITVVSGLARGIDSASHKGALKAKGRTLAVLGSGIANIYPGENKKLASDIAENGAVISEFPMDVIPDKVNFPKRNRVVSGLSLGVVVVEAGEKSGSLITADFALDEGKEVFAVPGKVDSINSRGTNRLIKQGAKLTSVVEDITEELEGYLPSVKTAGIKNNLSSVLDKNENLVYTLLSSDPMHIDDICRESGIAFNKLANILLGMEIRKLAKQLPGKNFVKI